MGGRDSLLERFGEEGDGGKEEGGDRWRLVRRIRRRRCCGEGGVGRDKERRNRNMSRRCT